jgi:hypothetical protein
MPEVGIIEPARSQPQQTLDLVWGAENIGRIINRSTRQTFHLLAKGEITGARKVGSSWVVSRSALRNQFCADIDDGHST